MYSVSRDSVSISHEKVDSSENRPISSLECKNHTLFVTKMAKIPGLWSKPLGLHNREIAHIRGQAPTPTFSPPPLPRSLVHLYPRLTLVDSKNSKLFKEFSSLLPGPLFFILSFTLQYPSPVYAFFLQILWGQVAGSHEFQPVWIRGAGCKDQVSCPCEYLFWGKNG